MTVETLFATAGKTPHINGVLSTPPPRTPVTGIPLLDSIFASAGPPAPPSSSLQPPEQPDPIIHSPKPFASALPQILNQDVIANLLGLPTSRASSTNSFSSSREADCEDQSAASTASDMETTPGSNNMLGLAAAQAPVNGDVTPRALGTSLSSIPAPPTQSSATSRSTPPQAVFVPLNDNSNGRRLVPFDDADAQLWPYPRAPIDEDQEELVELDFRDTSALSDSEKFMREAARSKYKATEDGTSESEVGRKEKRGGKNSKANKKKRNAKERAEIEKSWDLPDAVHAPEPAPIESPATAKPYVNGKAKAIVNGHDHPTSGLDPAILKASVINTLSAVQLPMEKNDFMREVLTLMHVRLFPSRCFPWPHNPNQTDKAFGDSLWKDYLSRTT